MSLFILLSSCDAPSVFLNNLICNMTHYTISHNYPSLNCPIPIKHQLQDKAKLWSDTNIVKVVFMNNDEDTAELMQRNSSSWSRAANTIQIGDLSPVEAMNFLLQDRVMESAVAGVGNAERVMGKGQAEKVYKMVGGRILDLLIFKRDISKGVPVDVIAEELKEREREKFVRVSSVPSLWQVVSLLRKVCSCWCGGSCKCCCSCFGSFYL